ncbi:MAG: 23S rRNA (guanosine(2251)-2'-O)-methyltransferase RlmB [Firmicutes bacterium]|nr:23S rRNA (guanosine(2251)-2'-O)-methyltransferase RlmB [Bacillota bacterium]
MSRQLEGRNPVLEALKAGTTIKKLIIQKGEKHGSILKIMAIAKERGIPLQEIDKKDMDSMSKTYGHQGVIALISEYKYYEVDEILDIAREKGDLPFIVILDKIEDPHNLGSIIRTSNAAGVHGVVIPRRRSVSVTPVVAKSSAGAVEYVPVAREVNLSRTVDMLKEKGLWIAGADMEGASIYELDLTGPLALVIGSEGKGISRLLKEKCDFLVSIPMVGRITSLNAATAGAIIIYEIFRQRLYKRQRG